MRLKTTVKQVGLMPEVRFSSSIPHVPALSLTTNLSGVSQIGEAECLPTHRLKMKSNCDKRKMLERQRIRREPAEEPESSLVLEESPRYIIDYLPLCAEEDWEMLSQAMAKPQAE